MDRSAQSNQLFSAASKVIQNYISSLNVTDIWCLQHPNRDYSFFSSSHSSFSRVYYFSLDSNLIPNGISSSYHNILISDHSPGTFILDIFQKQQQFTWRFHPFLLSDFKFNQFIFSKLCFCEFVEINNSAEMTDSTLWETLKVVIRRHIDFEAAAKEK